MSQTGQLLVLLLESVAQRGCYNQQDYCSKLDGLLDTLDGTQYSGMERTVYNPLGSIVIIVKSVGVGLQGGFYLAAKVWWVVQLAAIE